MSRAPSIVSTAPDTKSPPGEASSATIQATSSARPRRPSGTVDAAPSTIGLRVLGHEGVGGELPGGDRDQADAEARPLDREDPRQVLDGGARGRRVRHARQPVVGRERHVDDLAAARPRGSSPCVATAWVISHVPSTLSRITVRKPFGVMSSAGVRNWPPALLTSRSMRPWRSSDAVDQRGHLVLLADVARRGLAAAAVGQRRGLAQRLLAAPAHHDPRAQRRELERGRAAEARAAAADDRDLALEQAAVAEDCARARGLHGPSTRGSRFSKNARTPSWMSSVENAIVSWERRKSHASSSAMSCWRHSASLPRRMSTGDLAASRPGPVGDRGVELVHGHDPVDQPQPLGLVRVDALAEQQQLGRLLARDVAVDRAP